MTKKPVRPAPTTSKMDWILRKWSKVNNVKLWTVSFVIFICHQTRAFNLDEVELNSNMPRFLPTPTFYTAQVGQTAILECAITDLDEKKVIWRKASDPNPLTVGKETFWEDHRFMLEHDPGSQHWNLLIKRVRLQDAGVYECQVSSKLRHLRHHVLLEVHDTREPISTPTPRPSIHISGSTAVDKDDRIYLICNATGLEYPPEDLDWFFEGIKLATNADEKTFIQKFVSLTDKTIVSILEIRDAQLDHSGIYTCRTSNLLVKSTQVTVLSADTYNVKRGTDKGSKGTPSARLRLSSYASHRLHCLTVVSLLLIVRLSLMLTLSTWSLYG